MIVIAIMVSIFVLIGFSGVVLYSFWRDPQKPTNWGISRWWFGHQWQKNVTKSGVETPIFDNQGKPVMEHAPGRWHEVKKKLTKVIFKSLIFIFLPIFVLVAMEWMGNTVFSVLLSLALAFMVIVISSEITFKKPWKALVIGATIGLVSFAFLELVNAPIVRACWLMCTLGVILYLMEEVVGPNIFPKGLAVLCTVMLVVNILQAISVMVMGHAIYLDMFSPPPRLEVLTTEHGTKENISDLATDDHLISKTGSFGRIHSDHLVGEPYITTDGIPQSMWVWLKTRTTRHVTETPLLRHPVAEWSRFRAVLEELLHCWIWFWTQLLILIFAVPTDVQQWLAKKKKERKEGKKAESSSSIEFFVLDFFNDFFVHAVYDNFFKKGVK